MQQYNDYVQAIIRYLVKNSTLKAYLANLEAEKAAKEEMLRSTMASLTAQYALTAGCQSAGNTSDKVFDETCKRQKLQEEINRLSCNIAELKSNLGGVDRALLSLPEDERIILIEKWINKNSWEYISQKVNCSIKTCRRKQASALRDMATAIFGGKASNDSQLQFVFFPVDN